MKFLFASFRFSLFSHPMRLRAFQIKDYGLTTERKALFAFQIIMHTGMNVESMLYFIQGLKDVIFLLSAFVFLCSPFRQGSTRINDKDLRKRFVRLSNAECRKYVYSIDII